MSGHSTYLTTSLSSQTYWILMEIDKIQGISLWNVSFKLTLADRNIQVIFCLKVVLKSWDWIFLGTTTSFQKTNIDWPHQPPTETLSILVKNWVFDDSFHIKRTGNGHLGASDDQTIRISRFFDEMRLLRSLRPLRLLRPLRSLRSLRLQRF